MSRRFWKVVIHPEEGCPISEDDCDHCEHCKYIGTLGGEYYIDCNYE